MFWKWGNTAENCYSYTSTSFFNCCSRLKKFFLSKYISKKRHYGLTSSIYIFKSIHNSCTFCCFISLFVMCCHRLGNKWKKGQGISGFHKKLSFLNKDLVSRNKWKKISTNGYYLSYIRVEYIKAMQNFQIIILVVSHSLLSSVSFFFFFFCDFILGQNYFKYYFSVKIHFKSILTACDRFNTFSQFLNPTTDWQCIAVKLNSILWISTNL